MYSERTVLDLVGSIYDAAAEPQLWPSFLENLANVTKSKVATLFVQDLRSQHGNGNFTFNVDPAYTKAYAEHFAQKNIYMIRGKHLLRPGLVTPSQRLCPDEEALKSEFYNDWIAPQGQRYGLLGVLFQEQYVTSMLGAIRARRAPAFDQTEVSLVQALVPHLQRALQMNRRFRELETIQHSMTDALDRWSIGVVLIDARGHVVFANRAAAAILRQRDGFTSEHDGLHAARPPDTAALRGVIQGAIHTTNGNGLHAGGALALSRPSLKRPLNILVTPASRGHTVFGDPQAAAVLFVNDPEAADEAEADILRHLYGLTPAEAEVALRLIRGKNVRETADELAVKTNTVRIHLKKIFEKTGTRRQAELVRIILQGPAAIGSKKIKHYPFG